MKLTDWIHYNYRISWGTEFSRASKILSTNSEDINQAFHKALNLECQGVEKIAVHSGPVLAIDLTSLNPVAQDRTAIVLRFMPR